MVDLQDEVLFVLALRELTPHRIDYHAEFHARPSVQGLNHVATCIRCLLIEDLIKVSFEWVNEKEPNQYGEIGGHWRLIK